MRLSKKWMFGVLGVLGFAAAAVAQTINVPQVSTVNNTSDLIQILPNGAPVVGNKYATTSLITNAPGYVKITPATGATACTASPNNPAFCTGYNAAFANGQTYELIILTGTLAYSYAYTAASPSDGARECVTGSGGAITALTLLASGSQTVTGGTNVSLSAGSAVCWTYSLSNLTWDRS